MHISKNVREFSRVEIHMDAILTVQGQEPIRGRLHDVSMNGLCIECESELKAGDKCGVEILLGSPEDQISILAEGEVVRRLASSLAITFDSVDSEGFPHLHNLVLYNAGDTQGVEQEFAEHLGIKRK